MSLNEMYLADIPGIAAAGWVQIEYLASDIPGIAAAGWVQIEYLAFSQFVVENGIEVIEGQCPPFQVVGSLVGDRRIDVVVTQSRIDGIMDSSLALARLIALAVS